MLANNIPEALTFDDVLLVPAYSDVVPVQVSTDVRPGVVFLPMHWGAMSARAGEVNRLIFGAVDPISKQPEFKHCPVEVRRAVDEMLEGLGAVPTAWPSRAHS